jgi:Phage derived protein Gp49-like (DUF891)
LTTFNPRVNIRLVRIAATVVWEVIAQTDAGGRNVRTEIETLDQGYKHRETMLGLLKSEVPRNGPPSHNKNMSSPLRDDIFEFKAGPRKGRKLRVFWFYDAGNPTIPRRIICTHHVLKQSAKAHPDDIQHAVRVRKEYIRLKLMGLLPKVEEWEEV